jgi:hypothetical protein
MVLASLQSSVDGYESLYDLRQHVIFLASDFHIHELVYDGAWKVSDLTHLAGAPQAAEGCGIEGYVTSFNNQQHVIFFANDHHVHELVYDGHWRHHDLTHLAGAPRAFNIVGSGPNGYVTNCDNQQHVVFVGDNFHVYELYNDGSWHHNDLTHLTGAPAAGAMVKVEGGDWASPLAGYASTTCNNKRHVNFIGTDKHVHELLYDGSWHHNDLTHLSGAPAHAIADSLTGYETTYNHNLHVNFLAAAGEQPIHVIELVYDGVWRFNDLTHLAHAPSAAFASTLDGYMTSYNNLQHVHFVSDNGHVHELVYDGAWHDNDLTSLADAPRASVGLNLLDGYVTTYNNHQHVNFIGSDRHVHELVYDGAWHYNDLSVASS